MLNLEGSFDEGSNFSFELENFFCVTNLRPPFMHVEIEWDFFSPFRSKYSVLVRDSSSITEPEIRIRESSAKYWLCVITCIISKIG